MNPEHLPVDAYASQPLGSLDQASHIADSDTRQDVVVEPPQLVESSLIRRPEAGTVSTVTKAPPERTVSQMIQSCFIDILPIALDDKGTLRVTFGNLGIKALHGTCIDAMRAADISFENAIFVLNTMRRLQLELSMEHEISPKGIENLLNIITNLTNGAKKAKDRLEKVNQRWKLISLSPNAFLPSDVKYFTLPKDLDEADVVTVRILKLIKAQMIWYVGEDNIPAIFEDLEYAITRSDIIFSDQEALLSWMKSFISSLELLANDIAANKPRSMWMESIALLQRLSFMYILQIPSVNDRIPNDRETLFLHDTRIAIRRLKGSWLSINEVVRKPIDEWKPDDLQLCGRALLNRTKVLSDSPTRTAMFRAMITHVEKLGGGCYVILLSITCLPRDVCDWDEDLPLLQINKLDVGLTVRSAAASMGSSSTDVPLKLQVLHYNPSQISLDYSKTDKGPELALAFEAPDIPPSSGFKSEDKLEGWETEDYSVMEVAQTQDDCVRWAVSRNNSDSEDSDSNCSISGCSIAVTVIPPTPEIQLQVNIAADFINIVEGTESGHQIPISTTVDGAPCVINVEEVPLMGFNTSPQERAFIHGLR